jgi:hypothetical protein
MQEIPSTLWLLLRKQLRRSATSLESLKKIMEGTDPDLQDERDLAPPRMDWADDALLILNHAERELYGMINQASAEKFVKDL